MTTGCIGPFVEVIKLDEQSVARVRSDVPTYTSEQLKGRTYRVVLPLSATSCKSKFWDPSGTPEDAIDQLRAKAARAGANGILDPLCEAPEGTSLSKNCWQSVTCHAAGIVIGGFE
jgi:hypothetical protein